MKDVVRSGLFHLLSVGWVGIMVGGKRPLPSLSPYSHSRWSLLTVTSDERSEETSGKGDHRGDKVDNGWQKTRKQNMREYWAVITLSPLFVLPVVGLTPHSIRYASYPSEFDLPSVGSEDDRVRK